MTKQNQLLKLLDNVFGFEHIKNSSFKKIKQEFDEKRNEHVITIEYRVVKGNKQPQKTDDDSKREDIERKSLDLIRTINAEVNSQTDMEKTLETE